MSSPDSAGEGALRPASVYALGNDDEERERLRRQAVELSAQATTLLDRFGLRPGQSAIDLGCGPRGIIDLLSDRVGPHGRVVGLELDPANVALARSFVHNEGLENTTIIEGDARRTGLAAPSFDLVHARTLLINIPEPAAVTGVVGWALPADRTR
jgi:ubiquinone/menaquinone biosynthesis C-methylase UbiE